jgi:hypothetical protein
MRKILLEKIKNNYEIEYYAILDNEITPKIVYKYYPLSCQSLAVSCIRDNNNFFIVIMFERNRVKEYVYPKSFNKNLKDKILKIVKNYSDFKTFEKEVEFIFKNENIEIVEQKRKKANYTVDEFEIDFKKLNNQHY